MNLWNNPGIPHKGWKCFDIRDLKENGKVHATCMMCGKEKIRYVHWMKHEQYQKRFGVGCVCAGKMESNYKNAQNRERIFINIANRRKNWITRKWRISINGNPYLNIEDNNIVIFRCNKRWKYKVNDGFSIKTFETEEEAKLAVFDFLFFKKNQINKNYARHSNWNAFFI